MPPPILRLINQLFEAEKKAARNDAMQPLQKHLERMHAAIEEMGYRIHDPLGEEYTELRTDCRGNVAGDASRSLHITEVLKPAVYEETAGERRLIQKALVIADNTD
jgi:phosphoglycerate-specific signal transduction histidine kinase